MPRHKKIKSSTWEVYLFRQLKNHYLFCQALAKRNSAKSLLLLNAITDWSHYSAVINELRKGKLSVDEFVNWVPSSTYQKMIHNASLLSIILYEVPETLRLVVLNKIGKQSLNKLIIDYDHWHEINVRLADKDQLPFLQLLGVEAFFLWMRDEHLARLRGMLRLFYSHGLLSDFLNFVGKDFFHQRITSQKDLTILLYGDEFATFSCVMSKADVAIMLMFLAFFDKIKLNSLFKDVRRLKKLYHLISHENSADVVRDRARFSALIDIQTCSQIISPVSTMDFDNYETIYQIMWLLEVINRGAEVLSCFSEMLTRCTNTMTQLHQNLFIINKKFQTEYLHVLGEHKLCQLMTDYVKENKAITFQEALQELKAHGYSSHAYNILRSCLVKTFQTKVNMNSNHSHFSAMRRAKQPTHSSTPFIIQRHHQTSNH